MNQIEMVSTHTCQAFVSSGAEERKKETYINGQRMANALRDQFDEICDANIRKYSIRICVCVCVCDC